MKKTKYQLTVQVYCQKEGFKFLTFQLTKEDFLEKSFEETKKRVQAIDKNLIIIYPAYGEIEC